MLLIADITLKLLKIPVMYRAVLLLSGSKLFTDESGVRRYEPNKDVEQAGYINGDLAYRYKYRTNNLGLVSKYDYDIKKPLDLMVVGDSVTEGQEVGPWFNDIEEHLWKTSRKTTQNFAIAGNGFVEFERAAEFAKKKLNAQKAMIVFIGSDMFRPGDIMDANEQCSSYRTIINPNKIGCRSGNTTWFHYKKNLSDDELVSFAKTRQQFGLIKVIRKPIISTTYKMATYACRLNITFNSDRSIARRYHNHCKDIKEEDDLLILATTTTTTRPATLIPNYTIDALEKILRLYGPENVLLVGIPGGGHSINQLQTETIFRKKLDNKFETILKFVDISESCEMNGLWAPRPGKGPKRGWGHPTPEGYLKLQSCFLENKKIQEFIGL
jgi:hypothetical protein